LERTIDDRAPAADDAAKAREIAREVDGLALGLEQAGAYIATQHFGFARYLTLWRESRQKVLDWFDPTLMSYDRDVRLEKQSNLTKQPPCRPGDPPLVRPPRDH
jgi:hypothetical protein